MAGRRGGGQAGRRDPDEGTVATDGEDIASGPLRHAGGQRQHERDEQRCNPRHEHGGP